MSKRATDLFILDTIQALCGQMLPLLSTYIFPGHWTVSDWYRKNLNIFRITNQNILGQKNTLERFINCLLLSQRDQSYKDTTKMLPICSQKSLITRYKSASLVFISNDQWMMWPSPSSIIHRSWSRCRPSPGTGRASSSPSSSSSAWSASSSSPFRSWRPPPSPRGDALHS